jgi:hypothetical protein
MGRRTATDVRKGCVVKKERRCRLEKVRGKKARTVKDKWSDHLRCIYRGRVNLRKETFPSLSCEICSGLRSPERKEVVPLKV